MAGVRRSAKKTRLEIAHLAARLIATEGVNDFLFAKRKAAERSGIDNAGYLPSNQEIELALIAYQQIYQADSHAEKLQQLRRVASAVMTFLQAFKPFLVGPVLSGTATENSEIVLHLFSDEIEHVSYYLQNHHIPFNHTDKRVLPRFNDSRQQPAIDFIADEQKVVLVIFKLKERSLLPLSPITGRPMERASLSRLEQLMSKAQYAK